ncbi:hypothetical protein CMT75_18440 [Elizabethkingia anophelis]|nr:hypothetical protein [Elizabethkingia anophelis]
MNLELIKIENGKTAVQASKLYEGLGLKSNNYHRWCNKNIINNQFAVNNEDYTTFETSLGGSKQKKDFILSLDFAKRLAMIARTEKGEEIRNYFLACEKAVQENTTALNTELLHELETFREIERFKEVRNEANKNIRNSRKNLAAIQENVKQLSYKQLTLF